MRADSVGDVASARGKYVPLRCIPHAVGAEASMEEKGSRKKLKECERRSKFLAVKGGRHLGHMSASTKTRRTSMQCKTTLGLSPLSHYRSRSSQPSFRPVPTLYIHGVCPEQNHSHYPLHQECRVPLPGAVIASVASGMNSNCRPQTWKVIGGSCLSYRHPELRRSPDLRRSCLLCCSL